MELTIPNILSQNIYQKELEDKFLIVGSCVPSLYPNILNEFNTKWIHTFSICLEQSHYNQLHSKLAAILGTGRVKEVGFLTVDGSPHCVQVHYVSKYLKRELKAEVKFKHFVINREGKVFEVEMEKIDESRNLAGVGSEYNF